jgi:hypothetical protein
MSKGRLKMSDFTANGISVTKVHTALNQLLNSYLSEKEESRRDEDAYFMEYWESACQTIYDVAATLNIPLEVEPGKRPPNKPANVTDSPILT